MRVALLLALSAACWRGSYTADTRGTDIPNYAGRFSGPEGTFILRQRGTRVCGVFEYSLANDALPINADIVNGSLHVRATELRLKMTAHGLTITDGIGRGRVFARSRASNDPPWYRPKDDGSCYGTQPR